MSGTLFGKTVMVLGGSSPYGAAAARALGREGASVALGGRNRQRLEKLEVEIRAHGGETLVLGVPLAKRHHPAHLLEAAVEYFGGVDALPYVARANVPPLETLDIDARDRSLDVNVRGFVYCLAAALPAMRERGGGCGRGQRRGSRGRARSAPPCLASRGAHDLGELPGELPDYGVRAAEVGLDARQVRDPQGCAETIVRVLKDPESAGRRSG